MSAPQGLAYFPGINQIVSGSIDVVHGTNPSVAQITIAPQANFIGTGGTLQFAFDSINLNWPDAKIDLASFERNSNGEVWHLCIHDRRWKWLDLNGGNVISGAYNLRGTDHLPVTNPNTLPPINPTTEKTPQQLASLLLDALGETGYDVGDLPNDTRPPIDWDGAKPAEELAHLCDDLGCRIVLQFNNRIAIRQSGQGAQLPLDLILSNSLTIDPPERPDKLIVLCGHTRFQVDLPLEAVGEDVDFTWKLLDNLSYKPAGGWYASTGDLLGMSNVIGVTQRAFAKKTVLRYYRVVMPLTVPNYAKQITSLFQLLIENEQCEYEADADGNLVYKKASVHGVFFNNLHGNKNNVAALQPGLAAVAIGDTSGGGLYKKPFTIDAPRGLVIFGEIVYMNTESSQTPAKVTAGPANLVLRTAVQIRDPVTLAWVRYQKERDNGTNFGTKPRYVKHDEIVLTHVPQYSDPTSYSLTGDTTNQADVDPECDYYLQALDKDYQLKLPQTVTYPGLRVVEMDGALQHVTFSVGASGCTTTISRNTERRENVESYKEMRYRQKTKQAAREAQEQKKTFKQLKPPTTL